MKYDDKAKARDTKFRQKMKDNGFIRLCRWVKRDNIHPCSCHAFYLHGKAINTCKCACHEENK